MPDDNLSLEAFFSDKVSEVNGILRDLRTKVVSPLDGATGVLATINYPHHEIHSGAHYIFRSYYAVLRNGTKELLIVTPNTTKWAHAIIGFQISTSTVVVELFEGVATSDDGTLVLERNRNRNVADNNTTLIYGDPTVTGGAVAGNIVQNGIFGSGKNSFGGDTRDNEELVLKQNTKYLLRFKEQDVSAVNVNIYIDWYEHQDKV